AAAQPPGIDVPDPSAIRIRLGPVLLNPTVALTNLGVDNNVFNEPEDQHPKSDFTFTLTPAADLWMRAGSTWLYGRIVEDLNWYQTYWSGRKATTTTTVGGRAPLTGIGARVDAPRRNARDRPGYEIDARVDRAETQFNGLVELRMMSKTYIGVTAKHLGV